MKATLNYHLDKGAIAMTNHQDIYAVITIMDGKTYGGVTMFAHSDAKDAFDKIAALFNEAMKEVE